MHSANTSRSPHTSQAVDNADWLKTVAMVAVAVGHFGHFSSGTTNGGASSDAWRRRYSSTSSDTRAQSVPFHWIWLGIILTGLESLNADGKWVSPNILLSFAVIRVVRPYAHFFCNATVGSPLR